MELVEDEVSAIDGGAKLTERLGSIKSAATAMIRPAAIDPGLPRFDLDFFVDLADMNWLCPRYP